MKCQVRDVRPEDARGIVQVFNPIIEAGKYTAFVTPFTTKQEREYIENLHPRGIFHVAVLPQDQRIVGFQSLEPFSGYTKAFDHVGVLGTFIDLDYRRMGIGRTLFGATLKVAKKKGYEKLFTFILKDNDEGLAIYLKQGFEIVGTARKHAKINGRYIDEIIVEKLL